MSRVVSVRVDIPVRVDVPVRVENAARDGVPDTDSATDPARRCTR
ncbi:hypothetical protein ABZZ80_33065 [Streptomyces sp. NPDC006356]